MTDANGSKVTIPAGEGALGGDYTTALAYDAAGNLREQPLPTAGGLPAEKVTFSCTDLGFADSMTSDLGGFTYIKNTAFTLTGKLESRTLGANGQIKRLLERDPATDWLSRVTTQSKADTSTPDTVQDWDYILSGKTGRVRSRAASSPSTGVGGDWQGRRRGQDIFRITIRMLRDTPPWTLSARTLSSIRRCRDEQTI